MSQTTMPLHRASLDQQRAVETEALCRTLCERLLSDSLPPEEAYWWTRIVVEEAVGVLTRSLVDTAPDAVAA
jgi:hypothetical protein